MQFYASQGILLAEQLSQIDFPCEKEKSQTPLLPSPTSIPYPLYSDSNRTIQSCMLQGICITDIGRARRARTGVQGPNSALTEFLRVLKSQRYPLMLRVAVSVLMTSALSAVLEADRLVLLRPPISLLHPQQSLTFQKSRKTQKQRPKPKSKIPKKSSLQNLQQLVKQ